MFSYLAYIIKHLFNKQPLQFEKKKKKETSQESILNLSIKST